MNENNDIELADLIRKMQDLSGRLDSTMANESNHQLFKLLLRIVEEAQDAMQRLNKIKWPERDHA